MTMDIKTITKRAKENTSPDVFILWNKILTKAKNNTEYKKQLNIWLQREKSTVHFRDVIAAPFKKDKEFKDFFPWDWDNVWVSIDTISAQLFREEKINLISDNHILTMSRGDYSDEVLLTMSREKELKPVLKADDPNTEHTLSVIDKKIYIENKVFVRLDDNEKISDEEEKERLVYTSPKM